MIVESPSCSIGQVVRGRGWPVTSWGATGHLLSPEWGWEATLSSHWEQWQPPWPGLPWVVMATAHVRGHFKKNKCLWVSQVCTSGAGGASWVQLGSTGWSSACGRTGRCLLVGPWGLQPCGWGEQGLGEHHLFSWIDQLLCCEILLGHCLVLFVFSTWSVASCLNSPLHVLVAFCFSNFCCPFHSLMVWFQFVVFVSSFFFPETQRELNKCNT